MVNEIFWLDDQQSILVLKIPDYWDWEDMGSWLTTIQDLLDQQILSTTVIVDFQNSTFVPRDAVKKTHKIFRHLHGNIDPLVLTGLSISHRSVLSALFRIYPHLSTPIVLMDEPYDLSRTG